MTDDSAEILFQSFLQEANVNSSSMGSFSTAEKVKLSKNKRQVDVMKNYEA